MKSERGIRIGNTAKIMIGFGAVTLLVFILGGCCNNCEDNTVYDTVVVVDNFPPTPPDGVYSVTGDGVVSIYWNPNREPDLAGYAVYFNNDGGNLYQFLADVPPERNWYDDYNVTNGVTKYYAVLAYDTEGFESELSYEDVFDTPRPEGVNLVLYDYLGQNSSLSGYDFSSLTGAAQAWNSSTTDIYFGTPNGEYTLFAAGTGVDIQDFGYVETLDEVDWAPLNGWAPLKRVAVIPGHSYIVRVLDTKGSFNYAKIYVAEVTPDHVTLDWAYQVDPDNPELIASGGNPTPGGGK
jgi:hypothetical protein